ncbi:MAG TPA: PHP domain-containing protein [Armatimonadota bacterium]|jgi:hypothetical protein
MRRVTAPLLLSAAAVAGIAFGAVNRGGAGIGPAVDRIHSRRDREQIAARSLLYDVAPRPVRLSLPPGAAAIDTHVHTRYSHDSDAAVADDIVQAARCGLAAIAITDHNTMAGVPVAQAAVRSLQASGDIPATFTIIPGEEVSTTHGHIIALYAVSAIPRGLSPLETIRRIHAQHALAVALHPLERNGLGERANTLPFDAVETVDAADELSGIVHTGAARARRMAFLRNVTKPRLGASDAHEARLVGLCYTVLPHCRGAQAAIRHALYAGVTAPSSPPAVAARVESEVGGLSGAATAIPIVIAFYALLAVLSRRQRRVNPGFRQDNDGTANRRDGDNPLWRMGAAIGILMAGLLMKPERITPLGFWLLFAVALGCIEAGFYGRSRAMPPEVRIPSR